MKKTRGRWSPSPAQIELVLDCVKARMSLEKTAELCGVAAKCLAARQAYWSAISRAYRAG
jgi:hypothetical protein